MDVVETFREGIRPALPDGLRLRHQRFQLLINLAEGFPLWRIVGHTAIVRAIRLFKRQRLQQPGAVCLVVHRQLRQPGRPQRRADVAPGTVIELLAADIRQHLPPVSAARPAADKRDALRLDAAGVYHVHAIRQRITHSLQHRPRQLSRPMLMCQAKKDALGLRVVVRRAPVNFAAQSRQEAALSITDIRCQRPGSAWQKLCTALSGLLRNPSLTAK